LPITLPQDDKECLHLQVNDFGLSAGFDQVGDWIVVGYMDTNLGRTFIYEFTVTFHIVSESECDRRIGSSTSINRSICRIQCIKEQ